MTRPALPTAAEFRRWGIDPSWSRLIDVVGHDGHHTWHVLDTVPAESLSGGSDNARRPPTILCVHGNPTWSMLWRSLLHRLGDRYRVIAIDQLGMGFSDRTGSRRFAERVDDLAGIVEALHIEGPIVVAAHDWGGPISLGWVLRDPGRVCGVVLCNTGVAVPSGRRAPGLIRLAGAGPITDLVGRRTRLFLDGTLRLSGRRITAAAREGYRAPYRSAACRSAIAEFVDDVPFSTNHPSAAAVAEVADGVRSLDMPVLVTWGARDPVFNDDFALDLAGRMPHADRHRFQRCGHLVVEEADVAALVDGWLGDRVVSRCAQSIEPLVDRSTIDASTEPIWSALARRSGDTDVAFIDGARGTTTNFAELYEQVMGIAGGLASLGVRAGDRIAVLVPPGIDLLATVYGCWRAGAVTVIADRGLGLGGLGAAVRGADVRWVVGPRRALVVAQAMRWAPRASFIATSSNRIAARLLGVESTLEQLISAGAALPPEPGPDDVAAILYTSGATGPAKGVRYLHRQISAQRDALRALYGISETDRLVAAFAPFALYGPAFGIASTIPDVDVTAPGTLTADALAEAVQALNATIVFASPAALANVNRTAVDGELRLTALRLVLSAGAPVPIETLRSTARLCPAAELHTPYGMTECLPVADLSLDERERAGRGAGVCVGRPVAGASVLIAPLGFDAGDVVTAAPPGATGEVLVRAAWVADGYDQLWKTEHDARPADAAGSVWHRSGDVGRVDADGLLWIEGRSVHVIDSVAGPVTPVPVEVAVERLDGVDRAAAVGVGPPGCQQLVVVIEDPSRRDGLADESLTKATRVAVAHPVAAVLTVGALPVDIRHNTKIDRILLGRWAAALLAGDRARREW